MARPARAALALGALSLGAYACVRRPAEAVPAIAPAPLADVAAAPDTARGIVALVGNEPQAVLVLQPPAGQAGEVLALEGEAPALLRAVTGLEVTVAGTRTTERSIAAAPAGAPVFRVARFAVRAADGVAAHDGTLVWHDGAHWLRLADGREAPLVAIPAGLASRVGARVFVVGALDRAPQAYGVIDAR